MTARPKVDPSIFRRSDVRGLYPSQLNLEAAKIIGKVFHDWLLKNKSSPPITIAIGRDVRISSGELFTGFAEGIMKAGGHVIDLDLIGTEVINYVASTLDVDGAVVVSASHNPQQFNGIKFVKKGSVPIAFDSGLDEIRDLAVSSKTSPPKRRVFAKGNVTRVEILKSWSEYFKRFIDHTKIKPHIVMLDAGNGMAGMMLEYLLPYLPIKVTKLYFEPDGEFPNHIPNPMLVENLRDVIAEVKAQKADLGIAFDGDADRTIFIDETGRPINCSCLGALISTSEISQNPGATILYNAVCGRIVPQTIQSLGGKAIRTMVGHSVIKEKMRATSAVFAAEHSGHFYYKDYFQSDSSMLTVIKVLEILTRKGKKLSELITPLDIYPQSGEINFQVAQKEEIIDMVRKQFLHSAKSYDQLDGISLWWDDWWFNLRPSQNEDLLRLNVEANTDKLLEDQTSRLTSYILSLGAQPYIPY